MPSGYNRLVLRASDSKSGDKSLLTRTLSVKRHKYYTLVISGNSDDLDDSLTILPVLDESIDECENEKNDPEMSYVRFIHAAATAPAVDVWSRTPEGDVPVFEKFEYKDAAKYIKVDPGDLTLVVSPTGSTDAVLGPVVINLEKGKNYSVVATGVVGDAEYPLDAVLLVDRDLYICL